MKPAVAHYCDANHCRVVVDPDKGVCPDHWKMIPPQLQAKIYAVARKFKTRSQRLASVEFMETWAEAIEHIARAEGNPQRNAFRGLADALKRRQLVAGDDSCGGKKAYDTYALADHALRTTARHGSGDAGHMHVYRCRECRSFHFGHSLSKKVGDRKAKRA